MGRSRLSGEEPNDMLPGCLYFISLLSQFQYQLVREDFIDGKINLSRHHFSVVTLDEIDSLYQELVPSFHRPNEMPLKKRVKRSCKIIESMMNFSSDLLDLGVTGENIKTYTDWFLILSDIQNSAYWGMRDISDGPCNANSKLSCSSEDTVLENKITNTEEIVQRSIATSTEQLFQKSVSTDTVESDLETTCFINTSCFSEMKCDSWKTANLPKVVECSANTGEISKTSDVCNNVDNNQNKQEVNDTKSRFCDVDNTVHFVNVPRRTVPCSGLSTSREIPKINDLNNNVSPISCKWCHKRGHTVTQCWRKLHLCLICGGNHKMTDCSQYINSSRNFTPTCSLCSGAHLGKDCKWLRISVICNWCGKSGHAESNCWIKGNCCLICGDPIHKLVECPLFIPLDPIVSMPSFPPSCVRCGNAHLGDDCDSPYME